MLGALTLGALAASAQAGPCARDAKVPCVTLASGESMPLVAMGSWGGSDSCAVGNFTCHHAYARDSLKSWLDMGGRHIDTANDYKNQVAIGNFLSSYDLPREELFITTKCPGTIGYEAMIQCVDDNIQMLGLLGDGNLEVNGYIDLLLVHFPFKTPLSCRFKDLDACTEMADLFFGQNPTPKELFQSSWRALEDLKKLGVLKSIGVSSYNITQLEWTREIAMEPIDVNQVDWSPATHDDALLQYCKRHGITLQAWSPLGGNVVTDESYGMNPHLFTNPVLKKIASRHGVSTAQVMLRWSVQQGVAVTTSSGNPAHQKSDMGLWTFELSTSEIAAISSIAASLSAPSEQLTTLYE